MAIVWSCLLSPWRICAGDSFVTGESVKDINLIFAQQMFELGPCKLTCVVNPD